MTAVRMNLKMILAGDFLMVVCCLFYLAWWLVVFKPGAESAGKHTAYLLLAASIFGFAGLGILIGTLNRMELQRILFPHHCVLWGGVIAYFLLLFLTGFLMKRQVTTELVLIVGWAVLELCVINNLFGINTFSLKLSIVMSLMVILFAIVSLYCYLLYYQMDAVKGYIDGMIPLILVMAAMIIQSILVIMHRA